MKGRLSNAHYAIFTGLQRASAAKGLNPPTLDVPPRIQYNTRICGAFHKGLWQRVETHQERGKADEGVSFKSAFAFMYAMLCPDDYRSGNGA